MPLMPKRVKHRKMHRGSRSGNATSGTYVAFGDFGLQVLDRGWITNNQIEACRIAPSLRARSAMRSLPSTDVRPSAYATPNAVTLGVRLLMT